MKDCIEALAEQLNVPGEDMDIAVEETFLQEGISLSRRRRVLHLLPEVL